MPDAEQITEEGFGYFRGTWFMGRPLLEETEDVIRFEGEVLDALDRASAGPEEFEAFAKAVEDAHWADLPSHMASAFAQAGMVEFADWEGDPHPLGGLEIGVAGLSYALSFLRCPTAASCRSHVHQRSWSDCPVVFFAAPEWRMEILVELLGASRCGMDADRDMLKIFASSIRDMHDLAVLLLGKRGRFRRRPDEGQRRARRPRPVPDRQASLFECDPGARQGSGSASE